MALKITNRYMLDLIKRMYYELKEYRCKKAMFKNYHRMEGQYVTDIYEVNTKDPFIGEGKVVINHKGKSHVVDLW
jgi:hemin uptake protein HemP